MSSEIQLVSTLLAKLYRKINTYSIYFFLNLVYNFNKIYQKFSYSFHFGAINIKFRFFNTSITGKREFVKSNCNLQKLSRIPMILALEE